MKTILAVLSGAILAGMLASSMLCAGKMLSAEANRLILLAGTALWFIVVPCWMRLRRQEKSRPD